MARIGTTTARVYVGGGRRCLTRRAAYRREAIARVSAAYPCDCEPTEYDGSGMCVPGSACERHSWPAERWARLVRRLARFLMHLDRIERERGDVDARR